MRSSRVLLRTTNSRRKVVPCFPKKLNDVISKRFQSAPVYLRFSLIGASPERFSSTTPGIATRRRQRETFNAFPLWSQGIAFRPFSGKSGSENKALNTHSASTSQSSTISSKSADQDVNDPQNHPTNHHSSGTSDPSMVTWVDDYLPASLRPYAHLSRMDKPIGTWLLLWPCYWSTAMAAGMENTIDATTNSLIDVLPDPKLLGLFTVGAFVMRGAGCTINDLWDRDLDKAVTRTKTRPLAAGILTPTQAVGWLAVQLSAGLGVLLSLPHTEYCFWWGAASLPIVVAYPAMKRVFDYPQLVLGLCFNWGAFMGWAACHGSMDYNVVLPLYASGVFWTIGYDTLYAHQDKEDDAKLGLKSTAITFGRSSGDSKNIGFSVTSDDRSKQVLQKLAAATYASWLFAGYNDLMTAPAFGIYAIGITGAYSHLVWQIRTADLSDPHNLAERFRSNAKVGGIVFGSAVAGKLTLLCG